MYKYVLFALILLARLSAFAELSQGETLESQFWDNIKNQKWTDLEKQIAPYFQAAFFDEVLNKNQYLIHAKTVNISDYILSDFKSTDSPELIVVTYEIATSETIEGRPLTSKATRLSVWQKTNDQWQQIAHAILIPVPPPLPSPKGV